MEAQNKLVLLFLYISHALGLGFGLGLGRVVPCATRVVGRTFAAGLSPRTHVYGSVTNYVFIVFCSLRICRFSSRASVLNCHRCVISALVWGAFTSRRTQHLDTLYQEQWVRACAVEFSGLRAHVCGLATKWCLVFSCAVCDMRFALHPCCGDETLGFYLVFNLLCSAEY